MEQIEKDDVYEKDISLKTEDISKQLEELKRAQNAEMRVRIFADIMDQKGLDVVLGLIPGLGDGAVALIATAYLLLEAKIAKVPQKDMWNITKQQAMDFGIGAIPVVGDIADFFNKSNKKSLEYFTKRTQELSEQAKAHGIPQEEIDTLQKNTEKIRGLLKIVMENKEYIKAHVSNARKKIFGTLQKS